MASSTTSRGTHDAKTPSEIQSVSRPPATTSVCAMTRDHARAHPCAKRKPPNQDQLKLNGIAILGPKGHRRGYRLNALLPASRCDCSLHRDRKSWQNPAHFV